MNEDLGRMNPRKGTVINNSVQTNKVKTLTPERAVYDDMLDFSKKKNIGSVPVLGYLRFETSLQGTLGTIPFNILENQGTPNVTENRLALADMFTPLQYGLFITKVGSSATYSAVTDAQKAAAVLNTFPDAKTYTGAGESAALQAIYNGSIELRISNNVIIDSFPCIKFYRVPFAQNTYAGYLAGPAQAAGWDNENWGMVNFTPTISLMGSQNINLQITLPTAINLAGTSSSNMAVLILYGFLLQNGAKYN